MKITGLLGDYCPTGPTCPRIIDTDTEEVLVQGRTVTDPAVFDSLEKPIPAHESLVAVPRDLLYGATILNLEELVEWIGQNHTRDLFRLEVRDNYAVDSDGDDFRRYLHGEGEPDAAAKGPWLDQLARDTAKGRSWRKVHVVHNGRLSDYERYEFEWGFAFNVVAGEQVRILDVDSDRTEQLAVLGDYFVLDGEHVLRNLYDEAGHFIGGQVIYGGEAAAMRAVAGWVWDAAEPFTSWWDRHPQYRRAA